MHVIRWSLYPTLAANDTARRWLQSVADLGLASNTVEAYGRGVEQFLAFSRSMGVAAEAARRDHIAAYVGFASIKKSQSAEAPQPVANATLQQRLTAVRLYYDFLVQEQCIAVSPVHRGQFAPGRIGGRGKRGLVPRTRKLPWIPKEDEWAAFLGVLQRRPIRQRLMMCFAYDAALRREELCSLRTDDVDPSGRLLTIRPEATKNRNQRVVPYSPITGSLFQEYLSERRRLGLTRGPLFLSASNRNRGEPLSIWTWSKEVESMSAECGVNEFSTHTFRHLRLTDLARSGWDIHEIARMAGHRSIQSTLLYVHLSGADLAEKIAKTLAELTEARLASLNGAGQ
jgi:integrase/recombinase XerD